MKKTLAIIPVAFLLASCVESSYNGLRKGCVSTMTDDCISCEYKYNNGVAIYRIPVKHAQTISCEITTTFGEINFSISPINGDSLFARSLEEDGKFDVEIPNPGRYKIVVNTNQHCGSYLFNWGTSK